MLHNITKLYQFIHYNGLGFCVFRANYALRKKTGLLKLKFPAKLWSQINLVDLVKPQTTRPPEKFFQSHKSNGRHFFFDGENLPKINSCATSKLIAEADKILQNRFRYFFDENYDLGTPADWFLNPATGKRADSDKHWSTVNLFDADVGDIKFIWEPSRFAWVYTLVRAFAATSENKYAEKFWTLFESWLVANQPNTGPNYACGQECAIRLMAMCFAFYALTEANVSTIKRKTKLITAIAVHAERIEKNIKFAISTQTNHSLTEAAGLYTTGILFPEFKRSEHWLKLGKKILTNEGLKQIFPDGSYIQHSMNYHRLMLQDFICAIRLAQLNNDSFSTELIDSVEKAAEFLYQMQDKNSGRVPNYGANDGASIVPLNNCDYLDYRPVIQSAHYLLNKTRLYESGQWDEDLLWLFGPDAASAPKKNKTSESSEFQAGGYYTIRNKDSWAMMRCHSFKTRPGHADMLHLDLWWKGCNVLRDSGSFMYNCSEPWQSFFGSTAAHNTVVIDNTDQMPKLSRFARLNWTKSKFIAHKNYAADGVEIVQGEHYGYCRKKEKITHRRSVLSLPNGCWLIVDDALWRSTHKIELCWQLCDVDYELKDETLILQTENGRVCVAVAKSSGNGKCECFRGDNNSIGWQSLYYGNREPAPTLVYSAKAALPTRFITLISLGDVINNLKFGIDSMVSWRLDESEEEFVVGLNSTAADFGGSTFNFIKHKSKTLNLD